MRNAMRHTVMVGLAALTMGAAFDDAAARHRHRHYGYRHYAAPGVPHQFVFSTPEAANLVTSTGEFAGDFVTGIPAATTADPYQHPAYGYNQSGVYGPGYAYPGY